MGDMGEIKMKIEVDKDDLQEAINNLRKYARDIGLWGMDEHSSKLASLADSLRAQISIQHDPIVDAVRAKLRGRSDFGLGKYGVGLDRTDLTTRQWLVHLQEELMDAANYTEVLLGRIEDDDSER